MFSNVGKKCFKLWCVLCAVQFVTHKLKWNIPVRFLNFSYTYLLLLLKNVFMLVYNYDVSDV